MAITTAYAVVSYRHVLTSNQLTKLLIKTKVVSNTCIRGCRVLHVCFPLSMKVRGT